jgi:hypothetical protein
MPFRMFLRLLLVFGGLANSFAQSAPQAAASVTLAVHVLVACSGQGSGPAVKVPGVDGSLCYDRTGPFLTEKDVQSAELHKNSKGHAVVFLTFHENAAIHEMEITRKNIGNRVGIVLNGRMVAAPSIAASSRFLYIDGNYTAAQVEALVAGFNKQAGNR